VSSRLVGGLIGEAGHAEVWGFYEGSDLASLCWVGANMVPVEAAGEAADAFAARARRSTRRSSSLFGPRDDVLRLWAGIEPTWGKAREVRANQPLMVCDTPVLAPDPRVRRTRPAEIDTLFPASVAMFTEEIGYSPVGLDGGAGYRAGVTEMVGLGRSFVRIDPDAEGRPEVVFKAELGAVTGVVAQVQGVWVAPHRRGEGLAAPAVAAVVQAVHRDLGARSSLYVNDYNSRALHVYERVGFMVHGAFATVLL
jgi:predicted GNAT family acetyltransferase